MTLGLFICNCCEFGVFSTLCLTRHTAPHPHCAVRLHLFGRTVGVGGGEVTFAARRMLDIRVSL